MEALHPTAARALLDDDPQALLLDVREAWEMRLASPRVQAQQRLQMPMASVPLRLDEIPKAQPIVCICHHGARSAQVVAFLLQRGYSRVYNLAGGIEAWSTHVDATVPRY